MAKAKKPARTKAKPISGEHAAIQAMCDKHMAVTVYEGSDPTRHYVVTDNHMPGNPVSATIGDGEDATEVIERVKGHRG